MLSYNSLTNVPTTMPRLVEKRIKYILEFNSMFYPGAEIGSEAQARSLQ